MEAKVDIRKLQLLNDRINQTIEALNQVRLSVHSLSHTGVTNPIVPNPIFGQMGFPGVGYGVPQQGLIGQGVTPFGYLGGVGGLAHTGVTNPILGQTLGIPGVGYGYGQPLTGFGTGQFGYPNVGVGTTPFMGGGLQHTGIGSTIGNLPFGVNPWMQTNVGGIESLIDPQRLVQTFPYAFSNVQTGLPNVGGW